MTESELRDFDLSCWYLNRRRVLSLTGARALIPPLGGEDKAAQHMRELATTVGLEQALGDWLRRAKPPTLGQLITTGELTETSFFTHFGDFYSRGLSAVARAIAKGTAAVPQALLHARLDSLRPGWKLKVNFSHEHFTANSAWSELSGHRQLMVVGAVKRIDEQTIEALPWAIATPFVSWMEERSVVGSAWHNRLELYPEQIDAFSAIRGTQRERSRTALAVLKDIPENAVKHAFADIIGEAEVPKDWGGEKSDLFTSALSVGGQRVSAAFAFKGPARFSPMTLADLGKNGDQIVRLYEEPADLLVLQHCHVITTPVRAVMRAFAQRFGQLRTCCLIDGFDTLRVLRAYRKCGLEPTAADELGGSTLIADEDES